jgi:8-oxo-dGTP pyrophosphatase MutT (NUDIX family)
MDSEKWGIPKGTIDYGATPEETVLNEAWEEAGLKGRILGEPLGTYEYFKWYTTLLVVVYVMEVLEEHDDWKESRVRERRWASFTEAALLLMDHPVRVLLERARVVLADVASAELKPRR